MIIFIYSVNPEKDIWDVLTLRPQDKPFAGQHLVLTSKLKSPECQYTNFMSWFLKGCPEISAQTDFYNSFPFWTACFSWTETMLHSNYALNVWHWSIWFVHQSLVTLKLADQKTASQCPTGARSIKHRCKINNNACFGKFEDCFILHDTIAGIAALLTDLM